MPDVSSPAPELVEVIDARLAEVRARIGDACARVGRDPAGVRIIGITKTFPVAVVEAAIAAGLTDLGENRVQELDEKAGALPGRQQGGGVTWHLVGSLQRNKAKRAVELVDEFHALDSDRLARELEKRAAAAGRVLPCYVQVNVSGESSKFGLAPDDVAPFLSRLAAFEHLEVKGLMTLAAPAETEEELETVVRPQLRALSRLAAEHDPPLRLSMGMSGDFEVAIEEGATDVRLGTLLFGAR